MALSRSGCVSVGGDAATVMVRAKITSRQNAVRVVTVVFLMPTGDGFMGFLLFRDILTGIPGKGISTAKAAKGAKEKQSQHSAFSQTPCRPQQLQEGPEKSHHVEATATVSRSDCVAEC